MMIIKPLSYESLPTAIDLVRSCFATITHDTDLPARSLRASLDPDFAANFDDMRSVVSRDYWVGEVNGHVVGVIGLMETEDDFINTDWLNWFCVSKDFRREGYGEALLSKAIEESQKRRKAYLRLWTSDAKNETSAQFLYEKMGFKITSIKEEITGESTKILYRAKEIIS